MDNPLVSIIIPSYNSARFINETITSAINQTWQNKEIIVVDDGSTDETFSIIEKYKDKIKVFQQKNQGASSARNLGIKNAQGSLIQFLDADDLLSPTKIEDQVLALACNPNCIAVCITIHFFDGEDYKSKLPDPIDSKFMKNTDNTLHLIIDLLGGFDEVGGMIQPNAWLTPKSILDKAGNWDEALSVDDDGEYFCRVLLATDAVIFVPNIKNFYRKQFKGTNLSNLSNEKGMTSILEAAKKKQQHICKYRNDIVVKRMFNQIYYKIAVSCYPKFPHLSIEAKNLIDKDIPFNKNVILGGKLINFVANRIHWKFAKIVQEFGKKYLPKKQ